jgi:hypothetical protein
MPAPNRGEVWLVDLGYAAKVRRDRGRPKPMGLPLSQPRLAIPGTVHARETMAKSNPTLVIA